MQKAVHQQIYEKEKSYWWYLARIEILEQVFRSRIHRPGMEILNVGCGTGLISERFGKIGSVTSIDVSPDALSFCAVNRVQSLTRADAVSLPFQTGAFDACLALDVIEHIAAPDLALREISRVLKPEGMLLITVPAFQWMWSKMDDLGHHRRYTRAPLEQALVQGGLVPILLTYFNFFLFPLAVAQRFPERINHRRVNSENFLPALPAWVDRLFYRIFRSEKNLIEHIPLPFGLSILAIARKKEVSGDVS